MKYTSLIAILFFCQFALFAQHTNVLISSTYNPNEPTIMINPKNTDVILGAANLRNYYISEDGGYTWSTNRLSSSLGVWGDPVLIVDTSGHYYFFHLSNPSNGNWIDRIVCQKTTDNGQTWSDGSFMGLNGTKAQDKEWGIVDRTNNNIYVTWTQFDDYGSSNPADSSRILFSKSTDAGENWSPALRINKVAGDCMDSDDTVEGAVPAVGPNGEIYVAWAGPSGLVFNRSLDQGDTWMASETTVTDIPGGWDYAIPGIYRCNGLPVTVCDLSGGDYHGDIYINWTDQRNGTDDTDVWLVKSSDGGDTWTSPTRVNDDPDGRHQFLSWVTIDQTNGHLYFVFYDRREHEGSATDVYMAVSTDGGNTFNNFKISEEAFTPNSGIFFGDYTNVSAHNDVVRPIWTRLNDGALSMWTAIIDTDVISSIKEITKEEKRHELNQSFPNPASEEAYISFKLQKSSKITLLLFDALGNEVSRLIDNERYGYGKHIIKLSPDTLNLKTGTYFYTLSVDKQLLKRKMVVVE